MMRGRPVAVVSAPAAAPDVPAVESRSPGQAFRTRAQETLQALQLTDAALNRAVLMTRAGLLLHYDSLPQVGRELWRELQALERESAALAEDGDRRRRARDARADRRAVAEAASHRALHVGQRRTPKLDDLLRASRAAPEPRQPGGGAAAAALDAAHVLMQFVQAPESADSRGGGSRARHDLQAADLNPDTSGPLAAHGRIIVDLLPRVDGELRAILTSPVGARVEAVQQALLQSAGAAEARAQRFRLLLYASALVLLVYCCCIFARLRGERGGAAPKGAAADSGEQDDRPWHAGLQRRARDQQPQSDRAHQRRRACRRRWRTCWRPSTAVASPVT